jgi:hypothetical protein|tara:strand:- start:16 stop:525 length:510 start_codon:yes stop_codon:yes gene_type:complete
MKKRKMHEISTDIMKLQMGLDMQDPKEREIQLNDLFIELFSKEDGIYWLYTDNDKKIEMIKEHIKKCRNIINMIIRDNEQIKGMVINNYESVGNLPKHSIFNPVSIRKSGGAVGIEDESIIPREYFILVQEEKLDKKRVLEELRDGKKIPGIKLIKKPYVNGLKERGNK